MVASIAMALLSLVHHYWLFCILVAISGASQAALWPSCIKIVTGKLSQGSGSATTASIVGLLGTSPYAGAAFSAAFVTYVSDRYGWRLSLLPICLTSVVVALLIAILLSTSKDSKASMKSKMSSKDTPLSYSRLWSIKGVPEVTLSAVCLKFGRYALYMWLPKYLAESLGYSIAEAGMLSATFDLGGALGGPLVGYLLDRSSDR